MWAKLNDKDTTVGRTFRTFYQVFIGVFAITLVGWLGDVVTWAQCTEACNRFPELTVLGKAAVSAVASAAVAVVTLAQNSLES